MSDVVVVGAGIAGLCAATRLEAAGHRVTVLDKGRGVGGRMATRRFGDAVADHGAQFFTTKSDDGAAVVAPWIEAGAVEVWHERFLGDDGDSRVDGHLRYRGVPSMTGPAKLLAAELDDVRTGVRVASVLPTDGAWSLDLVDGRTIAAEGIVLTPPLPQLLELLGPAPLAPAVRERLAAITYHRCIAVLAELAATSSVPTPGAVRPRGGPVEWLADNQAKGVSPVPAVTIHLRPDESVDWWDEPDPVIVERAAAAVDGWLGAEIVATSVHRWRYARPVDVLPERAMLLTDAPPAVAAGDVFGGPLVEGALRSGLAAGELLASALS
ncbi:MAG: FAD-dependent oxidoreductase [Actinomycetota bacterium]